MGRAVICKLVKTLEGLGIKFQVLCRPLPLSWNFESELDLQSSRSGAENTTANGNGYYVLRKIIHGQAGRADLIRKCLVY